MPISSGESACVRGTRRRGSDQVLSDISTRIRPTNPLTLLGHPSGQRRPPAQTLGPWTPRVAVQMQPPLPRSKTRLAPSGRGLWTTRQSPEQPTSVDADELSVDPRAVVR